MAEKQTCCVTKKHAMAPDEKMLEELYELLTLYFEISPHGGFVKTCGNRLDVEPQLDRVIFKEKLLAQITSLIVGGEKLWED